MLILLYVGCDWLERHKVGLFLRRLVGGRSLAVQLILHSQFLVFILRNSLTRRLSEWYFSLELLSLLV